MGFFFHFPQLMASAEKESYLLNWQDIAENPPMGGFQNMEESLYGPRAGKLTKSRRIAAGNTLLKMKDSPSHHKTLITDK